MQKGYERLDNCYGTVSARCSKGVFIKLEDGQEAFAYKMSNLIPGTEVLCSILKLATKGKRIEVSIDSVVSYV